MEILRADFESIFENINLFQSTTEIATTSKMFERLHLNSLNNVILSNINFV